jgi:acetyl-CoA acetyltransferase
MGIGPAPAIRAALAKAGLQLSDLDLLEINEAFAGQIVAVVREMKLDERRLNVNGGAIASAPLGATGARLTLTLCGAPPPRRQRGSPRRASAAARGSLSSWRPFVIDLAGCTCS